MMKIIPLKGKKTLGAVRSYFCLTLGVCKAKQPEAAILLAILVFLISVGWKVSNDTILDLVNNPPQCDCINFHNIINLEHIWAKIYKRFWGEKKKQNNGWTDLISDFWRPAIAIIPDLTTMTVTTFQDFLFNSLFSQHQIYNIWLLLYQWSYYRIAKFKSVESL